MLPSGALRPITAEEIASQGVARLQPPADLWERIRRGFGMPNLEGDLVRQQEQWYSQRADYIGRMTDRSRKYLFHIVEELERRGMPTELALLPFIESAYNPQAVSSARAAGMWQFMPATGKDFELKQNVFRDDRRDVLASTRAALDYLQKLHGMFGDWHLALAAYNWGEGSVGRAIARNQKLGLPTGYADLTMPNETRNYVPKLQAVKNIIATPDQFRAELPLIENHPYFQTVTVRRDMDVALAARLADIKLEDFKALNPQLNHPVVLAAGTPQILLPWDNATVFKRNYESYTDGRYASWTAWSAPATMSVSEAARRVGMPENDLRTVNTIPPRMLIKAGSVLIVPRSSKSQEDDVASHVADNGQLSLAPEITTRRVVIKAGKRDSVVTVAQRYRLNPAQVAEWNGVVQAAAFKAGQQVVLQLPIQAGGAVHAPLRAAVAQGALRPAVAMRTATGTRAAVATRATVPTRAAVSARVAGPRPAVAAARPSQRGEPIKRKKRH
ncbi:transglycosylase SLT domain-containing protein [Ramlibacter sp.]|uniref:transglycosylase SLT domain-containing protein n=1 Tax=Ramlibacter sp. TaxID=1917967 RepID=UPI0025CB79B6|nr:transglycosylase SLT domain-containing protein [Ramlibacter sp.]